MGNETARYKIGDRVRYISGAHGNSKNNPLIGTEYECAGTVVRTENYGAISYSVSWDNGTTNAYQAMDLVLVGSQCKLDPNMSFRIKKLKYGKKYGY